MTGSGYAPVAHDEAQPNVPAGAALKVHPDGSYSYAYGPKGVSGLSANYYVVICALFASIGGLSFGYDQGVIANVLVMKDFLARWPVTPLQKGAMTAVLELGALVGSLLAGIFADRISRRHSIFLACIVFCIGSFFQCAAQNLPHIFIGRCIGGIGIGALSMLAPLYMAEISPPEVRGTLMALEQLAIVLGVILGFWTGYFTREIPSSYSWRIPLFIQIIPGVILGLGSFLLPPSPRLLVLQGQHSAALNSLALLRGRAPEETNNDVILQLEFLEMRAEALLVQRSYRDAAGGDGEEGGDIGGPKDEWNWGREVTIWKRLFQYKYRDRTLVGVLMMVFQQWSGINALLYYGPTLVQSIGMRGDTVTLAVSGGIGIMQFIAAIPAIILIDRWGRKPLLRLGTSVTFLSHLVISILVLQYSSNWPSHPLAAWTAVCAIYTFTFFYGISLGPIGWVLPSEVFPLSMRSKGVAVSTMSNWVNNFLIGLITPVIIEYSAAGTFLLFSTSCFAAYFWASYIIPETAGVSLEEIDKVFRSSSGAEERVLRRQIEEDVGLRDHLRGVAGDFGEEEHAS